MFLENLIPKRMLDIFSTVFHENTFENSIVQQMSFQGTIYSIKVFTRDLS